MLLENHCIGFSGFSLHTCFVAGGGIENSLFRKVPGGGLSFCVINFEA